MFRRNLLPLTHGQTVVPILRVDPKLCTLLKLNAIRIISNSHKKTIDAMFADLLLMTYDEENTPSLIN